MHYALGALLLTALGIYLCVRLPREASKRRENITSGVFVGLLACSMCLFAAAGGCGDGAIYVIFRLLFVVYAGILLVIVTLLSIWSVMND